MQKILVTGVAGFIGSHVAERLIKEGYDVVGVDNMHTGLQENLKRIPRVDFIHFDITDYYAVVWLIYTGKFDAIIHTGAIARTQDTIDDPILAHKVNATGTLNLLTASKDTTVKRFVHSSSSILNSPYTPYYVGKLCAEEYARIFPSIYGLSTISLRYANVYGDGQSQEGSYPNVLASFARSKRENGCITIYGDGSVTRDFVHISDVVEANILALKSKATGVYDIGSGIYYDIKSLAEMFDCPIRFEAPRKGDIQHIELDVSPAKEVLGFEAKVRVEDALKRDYLIKKKNI